MFLCCGKKKSSLRGNSVSVLPDPAPSYDTFSSAAKKIEIKSNNLQSSPSEQYLSNPMSGSNNNGPKR